MSKRKCDELLKLLPRLQCQECKDVPGASNDKKKRYVCINDHYLCEDHKGKCPCGSYVSKKPNSVVTTILEDSPF